MTEAMSAYQSLVAIFLKHLITMSNPGNMMLVFQGFPLPFYNALSQKNVKHFTGNWDGMYPDFNTVSGVNLLSEFITQQGVCWGFYEELIALSETLNDFSVYTGKIIVIKNNLFDNYYPLPIAEDSASIISSFESEKASDTDSRIFHFYSDYKIEGSNLLLSFVNRHFMVDINKEIEERDFYLIIQEEVPNTQLDFAITKVAVSSLPEIKCLLQKGAILNKHYQIKGDDSPKLHNELLALNILGSFYSVSFTISQSAKHSENGGEKYLPLLHHYWGDSANYRLRPFYKNPAIGKEVVDISQGAIISDIIDQCNSALSKNNSQYSDIIVTAPTGAGKSIFFQIPGIYLHELSSDNAITLVICPLVALMIDQVKELNDRGINYATYINSALTYEERQSRLEGIKSGRYSIIYLSPELLLAYDIHSLIGDRRIGLLVIDEAHLVTSWGRDFRVDYWFLGDHIEKIRRGSYYSKNAETNFPILCLTATAVFGGRDDIIGDLQNSLHLTCYSDHMYIGYVRRDNIEFIIRHPKKEKKSDKDEKLALTTAAICGYVKNGEKTIVYFPYKSQIEDVRTKLISDHPGVFLEVEKYYSGDMKSMEKDESYSNFRETKSHIMLATKAFGMGVNISDILNVYHYAPTGTLADYVQEIGRAARQLKKGYAITDYLKSDMHYAQTLWGLSGLRHYQIKAIIKKLYSLYAEKQHRNLLFSPETFSYLFDAKSVDTKVKSGLMLLSSDLLEKYHFKVIAVRPKNLFSNQYIIVPKKIENLFLEKFGKYCNRMEDSYQQIEYAYGKMSDITTTKSGDIFEIDLAQMWENEFVDTTFAQFKYQFFSGGLFNFGDENIVPNMKLIITWDKGYYEISEAFTALAIAIQDTFNDLKRNFGGRNFTFNDFTQLFKKYYKYDTRREYLRMLLELFCYDHVDIYDTPSEPWKFIERRKAEAENQVDSVFCFRTQKYAHISANLQRYYKQAAPNTPDRKKYITYLAIPKEGAKQSYQQLMASILQLFDFASYEFIGGRNPQIFVRINDPIKLRRIAESNREYKNSILTEIEDRHKRAVQIMNHFMVADFTTEERWELIENYFLGNDDVVDAMLNISSGQKVVETNRNIKLLATEVNKNCPEYLVGDIMAEYYETWDDAQGLPQAENFARFQIPMATHANSKLQINDQILELRFAWIEQHVAIIESSPDKIDKSFSSNGDWTFISADNIDFMLLKKLLCGDGK